MGEIRCTCGATDKAFHSPDCAVFDALSAASSGWTLQEPTIEWQAFAVKPHRSISGSGPTREAAIASVMRQIKAESDDPT